MDEMFIWNDAQKDMSTQDQLRVKEKHIFNYKP